MWRMGVTSPAVDPYESSSPAKIRADTPEIGATRQIA